MTAQSNIKFICAECKQGKYRVSEHECQEDKSRLGERAVGEGFAFSCDLKEEKK